uniref:Uncharacterized protein n=1 Tax=Daphnia galeata TaxID=27404 RepID=A0A8J2RLN3_9CRUS|nr:unnamed protein product [Daphnia galeata]
MDGLLGVMNVSIWLDGFVHFSLFTSLSEDIISQTDKIIEASLRLLHHQPSLQNEVVIALIFLFTEQVTHMRPRISAFGFFEVGKHLFSSVELKIHFSQKKLYS